jgi:superfamily II DNA/RNA helicase
VNLAQLQEWLLTDAIADDLNKLVRRTVADEIDNLAPDEEPRPRLDWPRLLLAASVLARSQNRTHQEAALRIATGALTLGPSQEVKDAGAILFEKLANARAVMLADHRGYLESNLHGRLGVSMRLEAERRKIDQSVLVRSSGEWLPVNDFQQRFWSSAGDHGWLSASAPTASGKTFLVLQWLVEQMRSGAAKVAVYLAPTRALVSEIEEQLQMLLGDSKIAVSSLPLRDRYDIALQGDVQQILVFTQERLHLLANAIGDAFQIDLLVVDEAHKIGDHQRGVVLQDAIERVERANPSMKVVFISPATQNPEELLADAPPGADTASVDSDSPTVLQNLIVAEQVPGKPKLWRLTARTRSGDLQVGVLQLASKASTLRKRLALIAAAAGERGGTLVYANGAAEAEEVAELISQIIPERDPDAELTELADLARKGVHRNFRLAPLVEKGVAFHYGNMPSLIRLEIERLFKTGKIRFLVCTSTLIEGVNLACRTIVLRGPRKGKGHPMEAHDFWNLAGRAGRWGNEFQGNIICIDPGDQNAWPSGVPERARYPIRRESDAVLDRSEGLSDYLSRRNSVPLSELTKEADEFEQVGAFLLTTYLRLGSITGANFAKRHDASALEKIDAQLSELAGDIEISAELAGRHPGVSPVGMQRLLDAFRAYENDPANLLPAEVESFDSYDRFVTIMRRINEYLYPAFEPDSAVKLHALIVVQWLQGMSLARMIQKTIDYQKELGREIKLPALIRNTMDLVEQTARFKAPKYLSAYMDILNLHLREIGREDLIDDGLDIGTQLEFGISSRTLLSLMELGLSRMSAVVLYEKIARDDLDKQACIEWVEERSEVLEALEIPAIIAREVREKVRVRKDASSR